MYHVSCITRVSAYVDRNAILHWELWMMDIMQAGLSYDLGYHEKVYRYDTITVLRISYNLGYQHIMHVTLRPYPLMNLSHSYILYHRNITKALGILWTCSHPSRDFSHPSATSGTRTWGKQKTMIIGTCFPLKNCRYEQSKRFIGRCYFHLCSDGICFTFSPIWKWWYCVLKSKALRHQMLDRPM